MSNVLQAIKDIKQGLSKRIDPEEARKKLRDQIQPRTRELQPRTRELSPRTPEIETTIRKSIQEAILIGCLSKKKKL